MDLVINKACLIMFLIVNAQAKCRDEQEEIPNSSSNIYKLGFSFSNVGLLHGVHPETTAVAFAIALIPQDQALKVIKWREPSKLVSNCGG